MSRIIRIKSKFVHTLPSGNQEVLVDFEVEGQPDDISKISPEFVKTLKEGLQELTKK